MTSQQGAGAVARAAPGPGAGAQNAQRALIVPPARPLPSVLPAAAPPAGHAPSPAWERIAAVWRAVLAGGHIHGHHPSLHEARLRHHEAAARWNAPAAKTLRIGYGYLIALPAKIVLDTAQLIINEPAVLAVTAVLFVLAYFFLLR